MAPVVLATVVGATAAVCNCQHALLHGGGIDLEREQRVSEIRLANEKRKDI